MSPKTPRAKVNNMNTDRAGSDASNAQASPGSDKDDEDEVPRASDAPDHPDNTRGNAKPSSHANAREDHTESSSNVDAACQATNDEVTRTSSRRHRPQTSITEARRASNRRSARRSRERQKNELMSLRQQITNLTEMNELLEQQVKLLTERNELALLTIQQLQNSLKTTRNAVAGDEVVVVSGGSNIASTNVENINSIRNFTGGLKSDAQHQQDSQVPTRYPDEVQSVGGNHYSSTNTANTDIGGQHSNIRGGSAEQWGHIINMIEPIPISEQGASGQASLKFAIDEPAGAMQLTVPQHKTQGSSLYHTTNQEAPRTDSIIRGSDTRGQDVVRENTNTTALNLPAVLSGLVPEQASLRASRLPTTKVTAHGFAGQPLQGISDSPASSKAALLTPRVFQQQEIQGLLNQTTAQILEQSALTPPQSLPYAKSQHDTTAVLPPTKKARHSSAEQSPYSDRKQHTNKEWATFE